MLPAYDMLGYVLGGFNTLARLAFLGWVFLTAIDFAGRLILRLLFRRPR